MTHDLIMDSTPTELTKVAQQQPQRLAYLATKRSFDVVVSAIALIALSPLLAIAALIVRVGSPGPIFFRQERVGRDLRTFRILKFRTMVADAPNLGGPITTADDPRITRIGRLLRKSKLDELPQLVNVLVGEMSLVGPRPEVPKYVDMFVDEYRQLLQARPGITDPASLKYRNENDLLRHAADPEIEYARLILPDKLRVSREYQERATLWSDLVVLFKTATGGD